MANYVNIDNSVYVRVNGSHITGSVELADGATIFAINNLDANKSVIVNNQDITSNTQFTITGTDITITAGNTATTGFSGANILYRASALKTGFATVGNKKVLVHADALYNTDGTEKEVPSQADIDAIELEIDGLTDDVADLNTGKLNANKSAVSAVGGLVTPTTTPTSTELVGVGTSNEQERITLGNGLTLENNVLSASGGGTQEGISYNIPVSELTALFQTNNDDIVNIYLLLRHVSGNVSVGAWTSSSVSDDTHGIKKVIVGDYAIYYLSPSGSYSLVIGYNSGSLFPANSFKFYTYNESSGAISQISNKAQTSSSAYYLCVSNNSDCLIVGIRKITT